MNIAQDQFSADKVFFHADRLRDAIAGRPVLPAVYEISPCGSCNQSCAYCVSRRFLSTHHLTLPQMLAIVDQIRELDGKAITLTGGGEPSTAPHLDEAIVHASEVGLSVGMLTNGAVLPSGLLSAVAAHASFCRFSVDTSSPGEYRRIRGVPQLSRVMANISLLVQEKCTTKSNVLIGVHIVWVDQLRSEIDQSIARFRSMGVDFVQIRPVDNVPYSLNSPHPPRSPSIRAFLHDMRRKYNDRSFNLVTTDDKWSEVLAGRLGNAYAGCPGANFTASIGPDMTVYFCCTHIGNPAFALGNLGEQSLRSILLSQTRASLISAVPHDACQHQCRNHRLNKLLASVARLSSGELDALIEQKGRSHQPMHWQFL